MEPVAQATDIVVRCAALLPFREPSQMKIPAGLANILCDLLAQSIHRGKLDFIPHALQEKDLHFRVSLQFNGMEVQEVSLDGERICSKGWPVSNVGHRLEAL